MKLFYYTEVLHLIQPFSLRFVTLPAKEVALTVRRIEEPDHAKTYTQVASIYVQDCYETQKQIGGAD